MAKNFRCEDQQKYIQSWEKQAKARRDQVGPAKNEEVCRLSGHRVVL